MATKKIKPIRFEIKIIDDGTDEQNLALSNALQDAGFAIVDDQEPNLVEYVHDPAVIDRPSAQKRALDRVIATLQSGLIRSTIAA
jgi:hypothetical protein